MFGVLTDNHDFPLAFDNLAFFANSLYGRSDLHGKRLLIVADAGMIRTIGALGFGWTPYLERQVILPRVRSYGDISSVTLSPGRMRIKFIRSFPEMCANT